MPGRTTGGGRTGGAGLARLVGGWALAWAVWGGPSAGRAATDEDAPSPAGPSVAAPMATTVPSTAKPAASTVSGAPVATPPNPAGAPTPGATLTAPLRALAPELTPALDVFAAGKFARARELFDNFATARASRAELKGPAQPEAALDWLVSHGDAPVAGAVRFLRARCDARVGNLAAADKGLEAAALALPELRDQIAAERARMALREGRFRDADRLAEQVSPANAAYFDLTVKRAQRQWRSGRVTDALQTLGSLTPVVVLRAERAQVARLLADVGLTLTGDRAAWLLRLADIWRTWPKSDAAFDAEPVLVSAAGDAAGVAASPLTLDELVDIALRRVDAGGVKLADLPAQALDKRFGRRATGLKVLLEARANARKKPGPARQALQTALATVTEPALRDRMWNVVATTLRQNERYEDALAMYGRIGRDGGASYRRAEALLEGGRMARRMGRVTDGRWFFDRYLARHREFPEARAEALWSLGWFAWREGRLDEADALFRQVVSETPETTDSSGRTYAERATYWRARILHRRGRTEEAASMWAELERRFPLSYYAALSASWRRRLGIDDAVLPLPSPEEPKSPPTVAQLGPMEPAAVPSLTLARLGLEAEARAVLRHANRTDRLGVSGVQLLSALYRADGNEALAHWVVQGADPLDVAPVKDGRGRWLSAFPRPFADIVEKEAKEHGIDPLVIWSVMRQESGFRTSARSHAKAHGLMQVLLPTARHVAKALLGERPPSLAKVYTPQANVHYGAAYLRHLLDRYRGSPALAFAGYNAGPGAVDKWLKRFGALDCDEFVEEIPYAEAQGYARKVIRSYAAYTYLYGPPDLPFLHLPLKLPNRQPVALRN